MRACWKATPWSCWRTEFKSSEAGPQAQGQPFKGSYGSRGGSLAWPCNPANARSSLAFSGQGHGVSRPSNPVVSSITFAWDGDMRSFAHPFRRRRDSNLRALEASRSELRFISRQPTCSGAGPSPGAASLRTLAPRSRSRGNAHGVSRPSNPFLFSITFSWARWLVGSWAQSFWRRGRDSNLPSLEASRPEGAAFQGKPRVPGAGPSPRPAALRTLALRSRSRGSGHGVSRPSNPSLFSITFSWARGS